MKPKITNIKTFKLSLYTVIFDFIFSSTEEWKLEANGTLTGMTLTHSLDRFTYYPEILAVNYNFCQT